MTWLLLTNFVDRMLVFHSIVVPDTNLEPLTAKVKAGPPCVPVLGDTAIKVGARLGG